MAISRWSDAGLGAVAGVLAGAAVALVLAGQDRLDLSQPLRADPPIVGWLAYLGLSICGGAVYGATYRFRPGALASAIGGGLLFGLLWWAAIWLTAVPLFTAAGPTWSVGDASRTFPLLVASVLAGGLTAVTFHWLGSRLIGNVAMTRTLAVTSVPVSHRIVILGGGFGGVATAQRLEQLLTHRPGVSVTLISDGNYLLFTPMLAEVASGSLVGRHVAAPLRATCPRTSIRLARVDAVDVEARTVRIIPFEGAAAESIPYDQLVVAVGAVPAFHGLPGVATRAFTLKSLADAMDLRDHVIGLLDRAESERQASERRRLLTFTVAGGGFAGVELIAELRDLVRAALVYHPRIGRDEPRFVLIHSKARILPELGEELATYAHERLRRRGIEFVLGVRVAGADRDGVSLSDGTTIPTETFVWTAGNEPAPLVGSLVSGREDRAVVTDEHLRVTGFDGIWAVGDCARVPDLDRIGEPCPPTAQYAVREGRQAAENIVASIDGRALRPFRFRSLGMLVVLGHNAAAAEIRGLRFSGLFAWFLWRGIYLAKLPGFDKKLRVLIDWLLDLTFPRDIVVAGRTTAGVGASRMAYEANDAPAS